MTKSAQPFKQEVFHSHTKSEEYYLVISGKLRIRIRDAEYLVKRLGMLIVPRKIPHKIIRFLYSLQHFTIRAPSALPEDKKIFKE